MSKRIFCAVMSLVLACVFCTSVCHAETVPTVSARSAVLIDAASGAVLYEHNADVPMGMASTTKIMTALTVLRLCDPEDTVVIPEEAVGIEGSSVYLCKGERLTVSALLYALLLASANDAAVALAIYCAGSVESFADEMNAYAAELGLTKTHFLNPHGLDAQGHQTTAYELALIAREALGNELLARIFSTYKTTIPFDGEQSTRLLVNHNKLLKSYNGAIGIKTGFTKACGRCLVSAAERDGMTLVCVTLNAPDDWRDHTALLDYGFENYHRRVVADVGEFEYTVDVVGGTGNRLVLSNTLPLVLTLPKSHGEVDTVVESCYRFVYAPVSRGDVTATVRVSGFGQQVSSPLAATENVHAAADTRSFWEKVFGK